MPLICSVKEFKETETNKAKRMRDEKRTNIRNWKAL